MSSLNNQNAALYFVDRHRENLENKPAFIEADSQAKTITYGDLAQKTDCMKSLYEQYDVRAEERAAMIVLDKIELPIIFWGSLKTGVIPILLNTLLSADLYQSILNDSKARVLFISPELFETVSSIFSELEYLKIVFVLADDIAKYQQQFPNLKFVAFNSTLAKSQPNKICVQMTHDSCAFWLYSSGSTGTPKGVKHIHGSLKAIADTYGQQVLKIKQDDVVFSVAKIFFAYGLGNAMIFPMSVGATTYLYAGRPTPETITAVINQANPTIFYGVPTFYAAFLAYCNGIKPQGTSKIRIAISAGEALPENIGKQWKELIGVDILDGVGSTEMLHIFLSNTREKVIYGTSGKAVPGYQLRLVNEEGKQVRVDEVGELLVKGESSAEGYWNRRQKSRTTFEGEWTRTGDKYEITEQGIYIYCGRADDMFKVSGIWVSPFEIEQALVSHSAVLEVAVIPRKDDEMLIKPMAYIVLKNQEQNKMQLLEDLKNLVKEKIGKWKYPRWIEFVDDLPKTATGKIQRFKLREKQKN